MIGFFNPILSIFGVRLQPIETEMKPTIQQAEQAAFESKNARNRACNRLKLVLMHDRTQIEPHVMEKMRNEMVNVIRKFVEIDETALELNLENDQTNTIALVANIPIVRARASQEEGSANPAATATTPKTTADKGITEPTPAAV